MPDLHTSTRELTIVQFGYYQHFTGTWFGVALPFLMGYSFAAPLFQVWHGARCQLSPDMSLERDRVRSLSISFNVDVLGAPCPLGELWVAVDTAQNTQAFSNANPPSDPGGWYQPMMAGWELWGYDDGTGWSAPTPPATITVQLAPATVTDPVTGTVLPDYTSAGAVGILESANAGGIINLSYAFDTAVNRLANVTSCVLEVTELDYFTGVTGARGNERPNDRCRVVRESRFRVPSWSDSLIEDGYRPGHWVRPAGWDPQEEFPDYVGNPREGVRDDDCPLE